MLWNNKDSELDTSIYTEDVQTLLETAIADSAEASYSKMTLLTLLLPVFTLTDGTEDFNALSPSGQGNWKQVLRIVNAHQNGDFPPDVCAELIDSAAVRTSGDINPFERDYWSDEAAEVVESLAPTSSLRDAYKAIFSAVKKSSAKEVKLFAEIFKTDGIITALGASASEIKVFDEAGNLFTDSFFFTALSTLHKAVSAAYVGGEGCGYSVNPLHLLYALFLANDGYAAQVLRRTISCPVAPEDVKNKLSGSMSFGKRANITITREMCSDKTAEILKTAAESAIETGSTQINERHLFIAILRSGDSGITSIIANVIKTSAAELEETALSYPYSPYFTTLPSSTLCESVNVSINVSDETGIVNRPEISEQIIKLLLRKDCHNVMVYGDKGVGKSTAASLIALTLTECESVELRQLPVVSIACDSIPENKLEDVIPQIFTFMEEYPRPIYVLDNFGVWLNAAEKVCIRRLEKNTYKCVLIGDNPDKKHLEELFGTVPLTHFIELEEPKEEIVEKMLAKRLPQIEESFGVKFEAGMGKYALRLAANYLLSKRFPIKVIALIESAAAEAGAKIALYGGETPVLGRREIAECIAETTGQPVENILGTGQDKDYSDLLSKHLMGQELAVRKVAARLDLIQKGRVDKKRPAGIFFFAGLSGTGKTELAKQISMLYSATHSLITFDMSSFTEPHNVSNLIGTSAGYVGYEAGGKLINDLNKDPYSLVLLDEVEKAHPQIWEPFLPLFDEGVITDMKGVKAYANRAFFVMTSNIGQYEIAQMIREQKSAEEIEYVVKNMIGDYKYKNGEKCFRPEFIGRILRSGGIVVFNALSLEAMEGITRQMARRLILEEAEIRDCKLEIDDEVISEIARIAYEENEVVLKKAKGQYFGGRRIDVLFDEMVQERLSAVSYRTLVNAKLLRIVMDGKKTVLVPVNNDEEIEAIARRQRNSILSRIEERLARVSAIDTDELDNLSVEKLSRLDSLLAQTQITAGV
ncbi:MAG: AAA family ATPase [Ruminococcus sp.]|jgi:ATP-dependent Clp protease ATP-binding subunit ClpA|nr:AAA family ATPase [Ruminococcus sp.]